MTNVAAERNAVEPFAHQVLDFVRQTDAKAAYALEAPIDPGIWRLYLYVREDLAGDPEYGERVANRAVDVLIEHDVALAPLLRARRS